VLAVEFYKQDSLIGVAVIDFRNFSLRQGAIWNSVEIRNPFAGTVEAVLEYGYCIGARSLVRDFCNRQSAALTIQNFVRNARIRRMLAKRPRAGREGQQSPDTVQPASVDRGVTIEAAEKQTTSSPPVQDPHIPVAVDDVCMPSPIVPALPFSEAPLLPEPSKEQGVPRKLPEWRKTVSGSVAVDYEDVMTFLPAEMRVRVEIVGCRGLRAAAMDLRSIYPELEFASHAGVNSFVRYTLASSGTNIRPTSVGVGVDQPHPLLLSLRQTSVRARSFDPLYNVTDTLSLPTTSASFSIMWDGCSVFEVWHMFPANRLNPGYSPTVSEAKLGECSVPLRSALLNPQGLSGYFSLVGETGHIVGEIGLKLSVDADTISALQEWLARKSLSRITLPRPGALPKASFAPTVAQSVVDSSSLDAVVSITVLIDHLTMDPDELEPLLLVYDEFYVSFSMYGEVQEIRTPRRTVSGSRCLFSFAKEFVKPKTEELLQFFSSQLMFSIHGYSSSKDDVIGCAFLNTSGLGAPLVGSSSTATSGTSDRGLHKKLRHVGGVSSVLDPSLETMLKHRLCVKVCWEEREAVRTAPLAERPAQSVRRSIAALDSDAESGTSSDESSFTYTLDSDSGPDVRSGTRLPIEDGGYRKDDEPEFYEDRETLLMRLREELSALDEIHLNLMAKLNS
jgi:hypothetical protein